MMKVYKGDMWRYHNDHEPKMIYNHEVEEYEANGWVDTPAKLEGSFEKSLEENQLVKASLEGMTRAQLISIAKDRNVVLKRNPNKADIIGAINGTDIK